MYIHICVHREATKQCLIFQITCLFKAHAFATSKFSWSKYCYQRHICKWCALSDNVSGQELALCKKKKAYNDVTLMV